MRATSEQELLKEITDLRQQITEMEKAHSERGHAESAWRVAKEEWEQSFNALTDDVCILDKTGKILRANKAMRDRFKTLHDDLVGLDYRVVYYETVTPSVCPPWEAVLWLCSCCALRAGGDRAAQVEVERPGVRGARTPGSRLSECRSGRTSERLPRCPS